MNLKDLARRGAHDLLIEMQDRTKAILKVFPDLKHLHDARGAMQPRKKRGMSAAARKAVSQRMKRYWKDKRSKK